VKWLALALALALAACEQPPREMYPVNPGGGGAVGSNSMPPDGAIDGNDGSTSTISGRVCIVSDARTATCGAGIAGLVVTLGASTTTTMADGSFTIARPTGTSLIWRVSGPSIVSSAMQFSADTTIPAIDNTLYDQMLAATLANTQLGDGAIIARFTKANAAVVGATVLASPAPFSAIYYDDVSVTEWATDVTGSYGVAWIPSIAPTASAQLTLQSGTSSTFTGIPVYADTITFALLVVP